MITIPKSPTIVFFGTSEFAIAPLKTLVEKFSIIAVITTPDKPAGRKNELSPSPIKLFAEKLGIPVLQPPSLKVDTLQLNIPPADVFIVCAYGKIIPKEILEKPHHGCINIHPSLLPRWRGPSPVQAAILAGDTKTGVTLIRMDEHMDHGPVILQEEYVIKDETTPELLKKLSELSARMIADIVHRWISGERTTEVQREEEVTYCKIIHKEDGRIRWDRPAVEIVRHIRAFAGWPGSFTYWERKGKPLQIKILGARELGSTIPVDNVPGAVRIADGTLSITTGRGILEVLTLQPEGKSVMPAASFIKGYADITGAMLT